jgi:diketogulonate reductase-like aldo/keto reductase
MAKTAPYDASADLTTQVRQSFDSSLNHLNTEYVDSYVLHGPHQRRGLGEADWEVWAAMEGLYQSGKTKMIGISNITAGQLTELCEQANLNPWLCKTGVCRASDGTKRFGRFAKRMASSIKAFRC